jgi:pantoate--beta-alanine ligase
MPTTTAATTGIDPAVLARYVDHTLLKPEATAADVDALVAEAAQLGVYSVCVSPSFLPLDLTAAPDLRLAAEAGADLVFAPEVAEVYAADASTVVEVSGGLTGVLDGDPARRGPEHFRGVTTVVAKLFNLADPDVAYFGQKDAQQAVVIRRMARDLDFPVRIEVMPTVREDDGLAMSSRNAYLEPADRERATALHRALDAAERGARNGSLAAGLEAARAELAAAAIEPEYLEARDAETLEPVAELGARPVLVAVAAQVGAARLSDNVLIQPPTSNQPNA